jgi:CRP/FNR family transcriptional regulator, cyclic AMP receptor protein
MFAHGLALAELYAFFHGLHGIVRDHLFEIIGVLAWAKALSAIGAAYERRMIPLRTMAMLGNWFGIAAGIGTGSLATFVEHAVNLPLNAVRLREMHRLIAKVRQSSESDLKVEWLKPFMHPRVLKAGSRVFSKGDEADEAFLLIEGQIEIPEKSVSIEPHAIFGEMALFTNSRRRTASAVCLSDVRLLVITYEQFEQLYFQNPEFSLYLIRLIVRRFEMDHRDEVARVSAA